MIHAFSEVGGLGLLCPYGLIVISFHNLEIVLYDWIGFYNLHMGNWALDIPSFTHWFSKYFIVCLLSPWLGPCLWDAWGLWNPNNMLQSSVTSVAMGICIAPSIQNFQGRETWVFRSWTLPLLCKRVYLGFVFLWSQEDLKIPPHPPQRARHR